MSHRGGPRKGSGRPKGRNVETVSITLPPAMLEKLDRLRGQRSRGAWIAESTTIKKPLDTLQNVFRVEV